MRARTTRPVDSTQRTDVSGVIVADAQGMLLRTEGTVPANTAAVTEIMRRAEQLDVDSGERPTICIEGEHRRILISSGEAGATIAVVMATAQPAE